jgi:hypothetical protein
MQTVRPIEVLLNDQNLRGDLRAIAQKVFDNQRITKE